MTLLNTSHVVAERSKIKAKWQEKFIHYCPEVALPEEINQNSHLLGREDFIVVRGGKDLDELLGILTCEYPIKVKKLSFNLPQVASIFLF